MNAELHEIKNTDLFFHYIKINGRRYTIPLYANPVDCKARLDMINFYKFSNPTTEETQRIEEINKQLSNENISKLVNVESNEEQITKTINSVDNSELNKIIEERTILVNKIVNITNNIELTIKKGLIKELSIYANSNNISETDKDFIKSIIFKLTQEQIIKNDDLNTYDIVYIYQLKYIFAIIHILYLPENDRQSAIKSLSSSDTITLPKNMQKVFDELDSYRIKEEEERIKIFKLKKEASTEIEKKRNEEFAEFERKQKEKEEQYIQAKKLEQLKNECMLKTNRSNFSIDEKLEQARKNAIAKSSSQQIYKIEKAFDPTTDNNESNIDIVTMSLADTSKYEIAMNSKLLNSPYKFDLIRIIKTGESNYKMFNELNIYNLDLVTSFVEFLINDLLYQKTFIYSVNKDTDTKIVKTLTALSKTICKSKDINYKVSENECIDFVFSWK